MTLILDCTKVCFINLNFSFIMGGMKVFVVFCFVSTFLYGAPVVESSDKLYVDRPRGVPLVSEYFCVYLSIVVVYS